jgi:hypothetical protein
MEITAGSAFQISPPATVISRRPGFVISEGMNNSAPQATSMDLSSMSKTNRAFEILALELPDANQELYV